MVDCAGRRDVSSCRWSTARSCDVTTIRRVRRTDDVIAHPDGQQWNVAAPVVRVQHQQTLVFV